MLMTAQKLADIKASSKIASVLAALGFVFGCFCGAYYQFSNIPEKYKFLFSVERGDPGYILRWHVNAVPVFGHFLLPEMTATKKEIAAPGVTSEDEKAKQESRELAKIIDDIPAFAISFGFLFALVFPAVAMVFDSIKNRRRVQH